MAVTIGELQVQFDAQIAELRSDFKKLDRTVTKFEKKTNKSADKVKKNFGGIKTAIVGVIAALGLFKGFQVFKGLVSGSIEAAASFEKYGVQLTNFLGNQSEATKAVGAFVDMAARTPFAVSEVVSAGVILGGVALANREALTELTATAINLAAVTGLSLKEAAGNLQRSLTAGIASADLFRERGVRRLIEAVASIPDLTKEPLERQRELFEEVFGTEGIFGSAAENLSFTLAGALSNIGDAAERAQAALGSAFGPSLIAGAREFLTPFLDRLRILVEENSAAILHFAFNAIRAMINAFVGLVRAGGNVVAFFGAWQMSVDQLLLSWLKLNRARLAFSPANLIGLDITKKKIERMDEAIKAQQLTVDSGVTGLSDLGVAIEAVASEAENMAKNFNSIDIDQYAQGIKDAGKTTAELQAALEAARDAEVVDKETAKAQLKNAKTLLKLTRDLELARLNASEPLRADLKALDEQIAKVRAMAIGEESATLQSKAITLLEQKRAETEATLTDETGKQVTLQDKLVASLTELARLDSDRAEKIKQVADKRLKEASGVEATNAALEVAIGKAEDAIDDNGEQLGTRLGDIMATGMKDSLDGFLRDEGFDFAEFLANASGNLLEASLGDALAAVAEKGKELFGHMLDNVGGGGGNFGAGISAALGVGMALASAAMRDTSESTRNSLVRRSQVQSAQAMRGVIAGPTSIGIGEVSLGIEEAFDGTNAILGDQTGILENILAAIKGTAGGGSGLEDTVTGELNGTPAFG